jgi:hypothetical protein
MVPDEKDWKKPTYVTFLFLTQLLFYFNVYFIQLQVMDVIKAFSSFIRLRTQRSMACSGSKRL